MFHQRYYLIVSFVPQMCFLHIKIGGDMNPYKVSDKCFKKLEILSLLFFNMYMYMCWLD